MSLISLNDVLGSSKVKVVKRLAVGQLGSDSAGRLGTMRTLSRKTKKCQMYIVLISLLMSIDTVMQLSMFARYEKCVVLMCVEYCGTTLSSEAAYNIKKPDFH